MIIVGGQTDVDAFFLEVVSWEIGLKLARLNQCSKWLCGDGVGCK
jgi:hypothetical protein